jgi:hypothetical protein
VEYVASIGEDRPWITYSDGNDGEPNYYRDAYSLGGTLMYCDGEVIDVTMMDETKVVFNNNLAGSDPDSNTEFEIPRGQFDMDFVPAI